MAEGELAAQLGDERGEGGAVGVAESGEAAVDVGEDAGGVGEDAGGGWRVRGGGEVDEIEADFDVGFDEAKLNAVA